MASLVAAFAAIYFIWGSTFLVIKYAIETLPPFLMAGTRYLSAGLILWCFVRYKDRSPLTFKHWRGTIIIGILMLVGGNGLVTVAEQYIASGLAALLIATTPMWLVLFDWLFCRGTRPTTLTTVGIVVGLVGVYLLLGPSSIAGAPVDTFGATLCLLACLFWAIGSLYSRHAGLPKSTLTSTAMQMLAGGAVMLVVGLALGEGSRVVWNAVSAKSLLSLAYLSIFGSIVALSAYSWLLKVTTAARVGTYAYVNPMVAIALGAIFANEPLSPRVLVAGAVILTAVVMITLAKARKTGASESIVSSIADRIEVLPKVADVLGDGTPSPVNAKSPCCVDG